MFSETKEIVQKLWQEKRLELVCLFIALIIPIFSFVIYQGSFPQEAKGEEIEFKTSPSTNKLVRNEKNLFIDVSGAVLEPDMYEVSPGARLKDVIKKAGGLSLKADIHFFQRNFNLARILIDQEKIYIPNMDEIAEGIFTEDTQKLRPSTSTPEKTTEESSDNIGININTATLQELDTLPGVGKVTAQKIIDNRPYTALEDLLSKKIISQTVFDKVHDLLEL